MELLIDNPIGLLESVIGLIEPFGLKIASSAWTQVKGKYVSECLPSINSASIFVLLL